MFEEDLAIHSTVIDNLLIFMDIIHCEQKQRWSWHTWAYILVGETGINKITYE